jgi:hypothetical protein
MMALYKFASRDFFSDVGKVPGMIRKRKLSFLPHFSSTAKAVRRVFKRAQLEEKKR